MEPEGLAAAIIIVVNGKTFLLVFIALNQSQSYLPKPSLLRDVSLGPGNPTQHLGWIGVSLCHSLMAKSQQTKTR